MFNNSESNLQPAGLGMFANSDESFMNLINQVSDDEAQMIKGGRGSESPPGLPTTPPGLEDDSSDKPGKGLDNRAFGETPPGLDKTKPFSDPD